MLKVKSTLESLEYAPTSGNATFVIHIVNGRKNPIIVSPNRFAVKAYDKNNNCIAKHLCGLPRATSPLAWTLVSPTPISRGKECIYTNKASGLPVMKAEEYRMPHRLPAYHLHPGYRVQRVHRKLDHLPGYCGPCFGLTLYTIFC